MTKEFKDWLDEFVDNGANPKDVTNWPEEAGGTVELQDKTVSPTTIRQEVLADENYDGLSKVTVNGVTSAIDKNIVSGNIKKDVSILGVTGNLEFETQDKTVSPSTIKQEVTPDEGYDGLSKVTVNAVTNTIDSNIKAANIKKDVSILGVKGTYDGETVELQDKTVTPTTNTQKIVADENYDGLGTVTINAVTNTIDKNIKAENIKKDVSILGVTGTYEGSDCVTYTCWYASVQLPRTLSNTSVATVGGNAYLFGGKNSSKNAVDTIYKFNIETETINELSTKLPQASYSMSAAAIGSNVYLFGGDNGSGSGIVNTIYK